VDGPVWHSELREGGRFIRDEVSEGDPIFFVNTDNILRPLRPRHVGHDTILLHRIGIEEKVLSCRFGKEYEEHARKTKKLVPYIY